MDNSFNAQSPYQDPQQQYQNPAVASMQGQIQQQQSDFQKTQQKRQSQNQESDTIFHTILQKLQDLEMNGIDTQAIGNMLQQVHKQTNVHNLTQQGQGQPQQQMPQQQQQNPLQGLMQGGQQALGNIGHAVQQIPQAASATWNDFIKQAQQIAQQRNFPVGVLLGQAALESARGAAAPGNNYFGIKGSGTAGSNTMATKEYAPGKGYYGENSGFAAYKSPADAINAYLNLIQNNYGIKTDAKSNPADILKQIEQHGYATSPTYVQNVMNTPEFQQFAKEMPAAVMGSVVPGALDNASHLAMYAQKGIPLMGEFEQAVNSGDKQAQQSVLQQVMGDPKYKDYLPTMYQMLQMASAAPSVSLDAMPMIAPLGPYQQLLQQQSRGGTNQ